MRKLMIVALASALAAAALTAPNFDKTTRTTLSARLAIVFPFTSGFY